MLVSLRWALICAQASAAICGGVHCRALSRLKFPGVLQSEMIAYSQSLTVPSPYDVSGRFQNCASLIEVSPHPEST